METSIESRLNTYHTLMGMFDGEDREIISNEPVLCLCDAIYRLNSKGLAPSKDIEDYPEIMKYKPDGKDINVSWFPYIREGIDQERARLLMKVIWDTTNPQNANPHTSRTF